MAKKIMVVGTMSNVGKSIVAAGLCRIFAEDGYRVAPFKSQNMALNSYVTEDGKEMGRAQAVQAECARITPDVRMNPILLKPTTDMGSQIIVNGVPVKNMSAKEYFSYKKELKSTIREAYEYLDNNYDIIVIEGAGSPAELNLKSDDIVNMGLAKMLLAPAILVGDINPGGIFAQLYGTIELLEADEKNYIKGMVINKFRGDVSILEPGIKILEEKCKKDVLGVIPYIKLDIEEEDSISERIENSTGNGIINIAVVRLPKISNYTDFMPLETNPYVKIKYVNKTEELDNADMIIVPGTKSTIEDAKWLKSSGLAAKIKRLHKQGVYVCGICGGYQILGKNITDTVGAENMGSIEGLAILPVNTYFQENKNTRRFDGIVCESGCSVEGYEIHMGESVLEKGARAFIKTATGYDGCVVENGFGTYFHGIFDNEIFTQELLKKLAQRKGISLEDGQFIDYKAYKEIQYNRLAKTVRENLDMKKIYEILEKGI